ncbi:MAG: hypothetical protein KJ963_04405, partial [Bacteroidetes bacterium]|nr:hypothetical protein [Bacteroidota bacterium]
MKYNSKFFVDLLADSFILRFIVSILITFDPIKKPLLIFQLSKGFSLNFSSSQLLNFFFPYHQ